jgi:hypothetical protein
VAVAANIRGALRQPDEEPAWRRRLVDVRETQTLEMKRARKMHNG